jgi:NhaP-type Na+/H+ or K+/H+ antiporter
MAHAVLSFNEQLERLGELAVVLVVGAMLADVERVAPGILLAVRLFIVVRPVATMLTLRRTSLSGRQRAFIAWFGVRGVGSVYYLAYALSHGVSGPTAQVLMDSTLVVVTASIVVHGVSVTPLMRRYSKRTTAREGTHEVAFLLRQQLQTASLLQPGCLPSTTSCLRTVQNARQRLTN